VQQSRNNGSSSSDAAMTHTGNLLISASQLVLLAFKAAECVKMIYTLPVALAEIKVKQDKLSFALFFVPVAKSIYDDRTV